MPEAQGSGIDKPFDLHSSATTPANKDNRIGKILLGIALGMALVLYLPTLWFGAVYDDHQLLMTNSQLNSWSSISFYFTHNIFENLFPSRSIYYRPLVMSVFIATTKLLGAKIWAYHLVSVLLYLLLIPSVFILLQELGFSRTAAGWGSLLFAVHPLHIEAVAWATGQTETIAAIPFVLMLALYRRAQRLENWPLFLASASIYILALLSKESAVTIPALAIFMELLWRAPRKRDAAIRLVTLFGITACYLMIRVAVLGEVAYRQLDLPPKTILLTIPSLLAFYFRQLMVPLNTSLFYDAYYVFSWHSLEFLLPGTLLVGILILLVWGRKRHWLTDAEVFCCVAMFVCVAPLLDLRLFRLHQFAHDRFVYLSSIFFVALLASLALRLAKSHILILSGLALFFGLVTETQVWNFKNDFAAFDHACSVAPNSLGPLLRMAAMLTEQGHRPEAKLYLHRVTLLVPDWAGPYYDLAKLEFDDGNLPEAEKQLRKSIALNPSEMQLHAFLAQILEREGKTAEAQAEAKLAPPAPEK